MPRPAIDKLFARYLDSEDSAAFIRAVSERYTVATLQRLAARGKRISRRGAVLALGYLGGYESNQVMGRALSDRDRGVRILAENGIRGVWLRAGNVSQRRQVLAITQLNDSLQFDDAIEQASNLIDDAPWYAEAFSARAVAFFNLEFYLQSQYDCEQTLELNPYHFAAAAGLGHCYLCQDDLPNALKCFRRALKLNPGLEGIRAQVTHLERSMRGR